MKKALKKSLLFVTLATVFVFFVVFASAAYFGDVDNDGSLTADDARSILRASVRLESFDKMQLLCADIDGDGYISSADARSALRMAVGLDELKIMDHEHDYVSSVTVKPACTSNGTETLICKICSYKATQTIEATGHKMGAWTVHIKPTADKEGSERRTCSQCGIYEERLLPKTAHKHIYKYETTLAPTCLKDGVRTGVCEICSVTKKETVKATGHDMSEWSVYVKPTAVKDGSERRKCSQCSHYEERVLPKTDHEHKYKSSVTTKPTCTKAGEMTLVCKICSFSKTETVKATGHNIGKWAVYTKPTVLSVGSERRNCSKCSYYEERVLPKLEHKHDYAYDVTTAATCTKNGVKTGVCKICSATKTETINATGHKLGSWTVKVKPTLAKEGLERRSCSQCSHYEERTVAKLSAHYYITVNDGVKAQYKITVASDGKYTLTAPQKTGYVFKGWKDSAGKEFAASGTVKANKTVNAVWEIDSTDTLKELIDRTDKGVDKIKITADITVDSPIFISYDTEIYTDGKYTIKRHPDYTGDIFVVGYDKSGQSAVLKHRKAVLTLKTEKGGSLTIDGNKSAVKTQVNGSLIYLTDSGIVNMYDGVKLIDNKKLGNDRIFESLDFVSEKALNRAGGAAVSVVNGTFNMYGGVMSGNEVATALDDTGEESNGCGGAVFNRSSFNMYGGEIKNNKALRGGGIYNDEWLIIECGNISSNYSASYGGGISTSSALDSQTFIGTATGSKKVVIADNSSVKSGGALYSNTRSPIVIYGNTTFRNNSSKSIGGAIYTAGGLTIRNTQFIGNRSASLGGAIYHNYADTTVTRRDLTVSDCTFDGNKAPYGGAIALGAVEAATKSGTYASIKSSVFSNNVAETGDGSGCGGAIYATKLADVIVNKCQFTGNSAEDCAGGIYVHGGTKAKISNSQFTKNSADYGAAVYAKAGTYTSTASSYTSNNAAKGKAIDSETGATVTVDGAVG